MHDPSSSPSVPTCLILGATGGIGSVLARTLHASGTRLVLAARDADRLRALAGELDAVAHPLDATSFDAVAECVAAARQHGGGRLHGIAHCVGSILLKPAHRTTEEEWRSVIETNLGTAFAVVRAAGAAMRDGGMVVLCSTAAAATGLANHEAIAAAKAGIEGLVRSAAATYANRNLRFAAVAPGLVDTPLAAPVTGSERSLEASRAMHPLGRIGRPDDVARAIAFLLDPQNDWITGQVLGVDGGLARARPLPRG